MRHEHGGKLYLLEKGGETSFAQVTYDRWLCSGCKGVTLVPQHQKMIVDGEIEVCAACTNSEGNNVAWEFAHPELNGHDPECVPDPKHLGYWICTEAGHPKSAAQDLDEDLSPTVRLLEALPETTQRGFRYVEIPFRDYRSSSERRISIQESSLASENRLWVGVNTVYADLNGTGDLMLMERAHLDEDTVRKLRDTLTAWLEA